MQANLSARIHYICTSCCQHLLDTDNGYDYVIILCIWLYCAPFAMINCHGLRFVECPRALWLNHEQWQCRKKYVLQMSGEGYQKMQVRSKLAWKKVKGTIKLALKTAAAVGKWVGAGQKHKSTGENTLTGNNSARDREGSFLCSRSLYLWASVWLAISARCRPCVPEGAKSTLSTKKETEKKGGKKRKGGKRGAKSHVSKSLFTLGVFLPQVFGCLCGMVKSFDVFASHQCYQQESFYLLGVFLPQVALAVFVCSLVKSFGVFA